MIDQVTTNYITWIDKTIADCSKYLRELDEAYDAKRKLNLVTKKPVLAICGPGGCGKDTVAKYICLKTGLSYGGSTSSIAAPIVAKMLDLPTEDAYAQRRSNRKLWYDVCCRLRHKDPARLIKYNLVHGDIVVGIRDSVELRDAIRQGVIDLSVWVHRDECTDPTIDFCDADCDIAISNNNSIFDLYHKLDRMVRVLIS